MKMKSSTRIPTKGNFELLLIMPLFAILLWGTFFLSQVFLNQGRLERASWVHSIGRTYKQPEETLQNRFLSHFSQEHAGLTLETVEDQSCGDRIFEILEEGRLDIRGSQGSCMQEVGEIVFNLTEDLPLSFKAFLGLNYRERHRMTATYNPMVPSGMDRDYSDRGFNLLDALTLETQNELVAPANDLYHDDHGGLISWRQAFWQEEMLDAGFQPLIPLQAVGAQEILEASFLPLGEIPGLDELAGMAFDEVSDQVRDTVMNHLTEELQNQFRDAIENQIQQYTEESLHELQEHFVEHSIFQ